MAKTPSASPFQALEEQAYHAFREWPLWLVLRERELTAHLTPSPSSHTPTGPQSPQTATAKTFVVKGE